MATLLQALFLTDEEKLIMNRLANVAKEHERPDEINDKYYEGTKRLNQIGIAVPPGLRDFETMVAWPSTVVDEIERRLDVKSFILPGESVAAQQLLEQWTANNLESEAPINHRETQVFGRGFVSVGTNSEDKEHPLIRVEPPRQMSALVSSATRQMIGALRAYKDWDRKSKRTLYLPNSTIWLERGRNGWIITDRDDHNLGRVPIVLFLNRKRAGDWSGRSEMASTIPLADAAARSLTNLQVAQEGLAVPGRYIFGVDPSKMVDAKTGKQIPVWEQYYTAMMAHADKDVKAGQFEAADLKNFTDTINHYGSLVASVTGLPMRYFTNSTVNPAAEGAIRAEESRLVKNVERKQTDNGDCWGWVMGLSERFRTGKWLDANQIRTEWHDAGTPTVGQKTDAIQKLNGGKAVLSREGSWDELGWSEARKAREREYFEKELREEWAAMEPKENEGPPSPVDPVLEAA